MSVPSLLCPCSFVPCRPLFPLTGPSRGLAQAAALFAGWELPWERQPLILELEPQGRTSARVQAPLHPLSQDGAKGSKHWQNRGSSQKAGPSATPAPPPLHTHMVSHQAPNTWCCGFWLDQCGLYTLFFFLGNRNVTHHNTSHGRLKCSQSRCKVVESGEGARTHHLPWHPNCWSWALRTLITIFSYVVPALYSWQSAFML